MPRSDSPPPTSLAPAPPLSLHVGEPDPPPAPAAVRAVLAAGRLAPGDRVLLTGPAAGAWEAALLPLGLRCDVARDRAHAADFVGRPGGAAFECALWAGPADDRCRGRAADVAALVRPGGGSLAVGRSADLAGSPPADAARVFDRTGPFRAAGPGGWVLHTAPGAAMNTAAPGAARPAPLAAAA